MLSHPDQQKLLINFFKTGQKLSYEKSQDIIGRGELPRGVFYIETGIVKSYDITRYGEENLLIIRKSGEVIGLTWAVTSDARPIINTAITPTIVYLVSREQLAAFISKHPAAAAPIIDMITIMYRMHSERIMTLGYRTVRERLASFLLTVSERFGVNGNGRILLDIPLKQQDIASSISATRETTSRALNTMQNQGIISLEQPYITILDRPTLVHIIS